MDQHAITSMIKSGKSNDEIHEMFLLERTRAVAPKYMYWKQREDSLDGYINAFKGMGLQVVSEKKDIVEKGWNGERKHTTVKFSTGITGLFLIIRWTKFPDNKRNKWTFNLTLEDENYWNIRLEYGFKHLDAIKEIANTLTEWNDIQKEWESVLDAVIKTRKKISIGDSTIDAILNQYLKINRFPYNICKDRGNTIVRIKLSHRRCIEIKLSPTMDMTKLTQIAKMVQTVDDAMKSVGYINLTVKNYGNDINWKNPGSI